MAEAYVVAAADVEAERRPGDTALVRTTIGPEHGCERLEQRVVRYAPGRSAERRLEDVDDVLYVASGHGTLLLDGEPHDLEPDMGVYARALR